MSGVSSPPVVPLAVAGLLVCVAVGALGVRYLGGDEEAAPPPPLPPPIVEPEKPAAPVDVAPVEPEPPAPPPASTTLKLYAAMSQEERVEFVDREARRMSRTIGTRPYAFSDESILIIKRYVDGYASRRSASASGVWRDGLDPLFDRARTYAPTICRAFRGRGLSPAIGLYIVMIESEYHRCLESPAGAVGMFQFVASTAAGYGVPANERCDVERMAPVCARYMSDMIAEFGADSLSVALAIASYNRGEGGIRTDLHKVLDSDNRERSFWTLVENAEKLPPGFQNENVKYVPKFFAAAIVGENPRVFGLDMRPLSTYEG